MEGTHNHKLRNNGVNDLCEEAGSSKNFIE